MDPKDPRIQEYLKQNNKTPPGMGEKPKPENYKAKAPEQHPQRRPIFKRRRGGVVLSREQVKEIKEGRKKLRKEMKARGIKSRQEFELAAGQAGLYFDSSNAFWLWLWGHRLGALLALLGLLIALMFFLSVVTQMRGHFTINLSDGMFREGFTLSETADFANPSTHLFATPAENVPCISIRQIPENVDSLDGSHNGVYFAYTFYARNEGDNTQDYVWSLNLNAEGKKLSVATWVMVFEDGKMRFYAKADENGQPEALPARDDSTRGYPEMPLYDFAAEPERQYEVVGTKNDRNYYRLLPIPFESDSVVCSGTQENVAPMEVHKYTVVLWLEGDDPDCTDALIGGHLGLDLGLRLVSEDPQKQSVWEEIWSELKFWDK